MKIHYCLSQFSDGLLHVVLRALLLQICMNLDPHVVVILALRIKMEVYMTRACYIIIIAVVVNVIIITIKECNVINK